jgi:hypothetical protein
LFVHDWAALTLEAPDRPVRIDRYYQGVAKRPGLGQVPNMAGVQEVEAAISKDYPLTFFAQPPALSNEVLSIKQLAHTSGDL